jgi:toxin ParE1/3/4
VKRYVLSPRAKIDLAEIWEYTAANWSIDQAEIYVRHIQLAIEAIADNPRLGRPCDEIRPGYRKHPAGSHVVFYRLTDAGVDVVRVLHGRMDFSERL